MRMVRGIVHLHPGFPRSSRPAPSPCRMARSSPGQKKDGSCVGAGGSSPVSSDAAGRTRGGPTWGARRGLAGSQTPGRQSEGGSPPPGRQEKPCRLNPGCQRSTTGTGRGGRGVGSGRAAAPGCPIGLMPLRHLQRQILSRGHPPPLFSFSSDEEGGGWTHVTTKPLETSNPS